MYCSSCGAWNPDDSDFCATCGCPMQRGRTSRGRGGMRTCLIIALAAFVLLIAVAAGAFLLRGQLMRAWQSILGQPARVTATPTAVATQAPTLVAPTSTPVPSSTPTAYQSPMPARTETPTMTPTTVQRMFTLVYRGCVPHALSLGSVKGQVFDKKGSVIPGAKVRITIDDYEWKSDANPATTNQDGWYEWTLEPGQRIKVVELIVGGHSVPYSPGNVEVTATGGCFQRIDFVEQ